MRPFRRVATVLNLVVVASIAAGTFSMCLEDGTNAARAMACCKAHENCDDTEMARQCCKHERAREAVTQTTAATSNDVAAMPHPTVLVVLMPFVVTTSFVVAPMSTPPAAESPPIFLVQHTFRI